MKEIIAQPREAIARFVSYKIGQAHLPWGEFTALGLAKDGELVAGVVYNHWSETNVCMHVGAVGKYWLTPEFLFAAFDYPFNQVGVRRVTGLVPKKNRQARKFDEHLGFKLEGSMRQALADDDLLVYGLLRQECRYISKDFMDRIARRASREQALATAAA